MEKQLVECPFYNYVYSFDDLPLDPAKEFILEKICKLSIFFLQHKSPPTFSLIEMSP